MQCILWVNTHTTGLCLRWKKIHWHFLVVATIVLCPANHWHSASDVPSPSPASFQLPMHNSNLHICVGHLPSGTVALNVYPAAIVLIEMLQVYLQSSPHNLFNSHAHAILSLANQCHQAHICRQPSPYIHFFSQGGSKFGRGSTELPHASTYTRTRLRMHAHTH